MLEPGGSNVLSLDDIFQIVSQSFLASGQIATITLWGGSLDRLVNLYRGRGPPGLEGGIWFV